MGSYSSSYRVQALAADIVFNKRIDVDALISDRYPLHHLDAAVEQAIAPGKDWGQLSSNQGMY